MAAFRQKGGQQRVLAPTFSQLPSAQNNQYAKLHSLGWHILILFHSKETFMTLTRDLHRLRSLTTVQLNEKSVKK